jgi:dolichol-phosphate mannosyltransferase
MDRTVGVASARPSNPSTQRKLAMLLDLNLIRPAPAPDRPGGRDPASASAEITIVTPTFNERGNLDELIGRVREALDGVAWELIVVDDDSPDGTAHRAHELHACDSRVRVIRRIGRRGLSSACLEGMLASSAPFLAVLDADLQHDPELLPRMLELLRADRADLVCASRNLAGGGAPGWAEHRVAASRLGAWAANSIGERRLSDPMSGFFAVRRDVVERVVGSLSGVGFKIMLDIVLAAGPGLRIVETASSRPESHGTTS